MQPRFLAAQPLLELPVALREIGGRAVTPDLQRPRHRPQGGVAERLHQPRDRRGVESLRRIGEDQQRTVGGAHGGIQRGGLAARCIASHHDYPGVDGPKLVGGRRRFPVEGHHHLEQVGGIVCTQHICHPRPNGRPVIDRRDHDAHRRA
jgi:hypothetical protein